MMDPKEVRHKQVTQRRPSNDQLVNMLREADELAQRLTHTIEANRRDTFLTIGREDAERIKQALETLSNVVRLSGGRR